MVDLSRSCSSFFYVQKKKHIEKSREKQVKNRFALLFSSLVVLSQDELIPLPHLVILYRTLHIAPPYR